MSGTLIAYKTENKIFKEFVEITNEALNFFNVKGWQVRQLRQVLTVNVLSPTVFISVITNNQSGSQYRGTQKTQTNIIETNSTKQEVKIRFSAALKRTIKDNEDTFYGIDVLKLISYYLQSPEGISLLSEYGYAQYRVSGVTNQNFIDDSEIVEFMPFFECEYLYTNSWSTEIPIIEEFTSGINKI